ncbi:MAG: RsmG family class I SAM-dependent methyltransferase [Vicinamibacterales bacterium]
MSTAIRLRARADSFGLQLTGSLEARLVAYFDLLFHWNSRINLTSLTDPDAAIDRLLLEPLAAARELEPHPELLDLGSGGGSPAIPLALALNARRLVMVESKSRKAAFLREAARVVELAAVVETARFEDVAGHGKHNGQMSLVSVRAVRMDLAALVTTRAFLKPAGRVALFTPTAASPAELPADLRVVKIAPLFNGAHLVVLGR